MAPLPFSRPRGLPQLDGPFTPRSSRGRAGYREDRRPHSSLGHSDVGGTIFGIGFAAAAAVYGSEKGRANSSLGFTGGRSTPTASKDWASERPSWDSRSVLTSMDFSVGCNDLDFVRNLRSSYVQARPRSQSPEFGAAEAVLPSVEDVDLPSASLELPSLQSIGERTLSRGTTPSGRYSPRARAGSPTWSVLSAAKAFVKPQIPQSPVAKKVYGERPHPSLRNKAALEILEKKKISPSSTRRSSRQQKVAEDGQAKQTGGQTQKGRRKSLQEILESNAEAPVLAPPPRCPHCDNLYMADSIFCRRCGKKRAMEEIEDQSLDTFEEKPLREYPSWLQDSLAATDKRERQSQLRFDFQTDEIEAPHDDGRSDDGEEPHYITVESRRGSFKNPDYSTERSHSLTSQTGLDKSLFDQDLEEGNEKEPPKMSQEEMWADIFNKLEEHKEIHLDDIPKALEFAGFVAPRYDWIKELFSQVSLFNTIELDDFLSLMKKYQKRQHEAYAEAFAAADLDGSGFIEEGEVAVLLNRFGIHPMSHVLKEVIEEVDLDGKGELDIDEFKQLMYLVAAREGFTKSEHEEFTMIFGRFDRDKNGEIDTVELAQILNWLGFAWDIRRTQAVVKDIDVDGSGTINQREFLMCMRKVRETELATVISMMKQGKSADGEEISCTIDEVPEILKGLGYEPWNQQVIFEAGEQAGLEGKKHLEIGEVWRLLMNYRVSEGFVNMDVEDMNKAFYRHDKDNSGELTNIEAPRALRDLGYTASFEVQQSVLSKVDVDDTGELNLMEFRKMIRMLQERDAGFYRDLFREEADGRKFIPPQKAAQAITKLGWRVNVFHLYARSNDASARAKAVLEARSEKSIDEDNFVRACCQHAIEHRQTYKQNGGWSHDEVHEFRTTFNKYDSKKTGKLVKGDLVKLVNDIFPELAKDRLMRPQLQDMMRQAADQSGSLGFNEFLTLMRLFREFQDRERVQKETNAIKQTGFSPGEVADFRELYLAADDGSGSLSFEELRAMINVITPLGDTLTAELRKVFKEYTQKKLYSTHDNSSEADFPEFLLMMKHLLSHDFANLEEKCFIFTQSTPEEA